MKSHYFCLKKRYVHSGEIFMRRALELARLGLGKVSPNPMVGCVIVAEGIIIGEGFHQYYGGPHAEVYAVQSVKNTRPLQHSTVYVTLEPCAHHGKTPPCANLLVDCQVQKVVIANKDPNPLVSGKGIQILEEGGIEVETGLLEKAGHDLNKRFFKAMTQKQAYVILKWAQTADGFIARNDYTSKWISNKYSRKVTHKWRSEEDAVLVGKNTAKYDDPRLDVRYWTGKNPLRVVIDHQLSLDDTYKLFDQQLPTVCYNLEYTSEKQNLQFQKLPEPGFLSALLQDLHNRGIGSVIVEGGASTINAFIEAGLWDEARVFTAPITFGSGIRVPQLTNATLQEVQDIEGDTLHYFRKK
jgi:diaminohydroxyphosphoribosylaminopyrimidine deaminase/5-amino-6-(5-phosphoribosylamino)uracil reductase